jgi:putative salt-induced outer membrane protein
MKLARSILCAAAMALPATAHAALPDPVRAMIEAAIATGDKAKVAAVVEVARQTNPDDIAEIDALDKAFKTKLVERAAAESKRREAAIREAGLFDNWHGKGEVGASRSTGNSHDTGVTLALTLDRKGIDWQHKLRARLDYQRSNGHTSREQYLFAYEPRYQIHSDLFAYGLAQYEHDKLQGLASRYSASGGLGYQLIDRRNLHLAVKAGPSFRHTEYIGGEAQDSVGALAGFDFDWQIAKRLKFTQDANMVADTGGSAVVIVDSTATSVKLVSGLEAKVSDRLTTRFSYTVDYNSNPPAGAVGTDTLSRFTLVYGF